MVELGLIEKAGQYLWKGLGLVYKFQQKKLLERDLFPYFDRYEVKQATEHFIETHYQSTPPSQYDEPGKKGIIHARQPLIPFFLKEAFKEKDAHRFYLILADSGMGKTTFLINLYMQFIKQDRIFGPAYDMRFFHLNDPEVLVKISGIEDKKRTVLLLDAFDEDQKAVEDYQKRIDEIIETVKEFREVVITSRTQFFTSQKEEPFETKLQKYYGQERYHTFNRLYLSPLTDEEIKAYLKKRYPRKEKEKRAKAYEIVQRSPNLMVRPMLLNYVNDLLESEADFQDTHEIYAELINKWIEREANRVGLARREKYEKELMRFSREVALDINAKKNQRNGLFIQPPTIRPASFTFSEI